MGRRTVGNMARIRDFLDDSSPVLEPAQAQTFDERVLSYFTPAYGAQPVGETWRHSESSFWRAFCHVQRHPPSNAFPEEVERAARYIAHGLLRGLLEDAPGPRGGIGWQISLSYLEAEHQKQQKQKNQAEKSREKVKTLRSRVGTMTLDEVDYVVRVTYPELDLIGLSYTNRYGSRLQSTSDILEHYFRRKRYRRVQRYGLCGFVGKWQDWKTVQQVIDDLDTRMLDAITRAITISEQKLAELKAIISEQEEREDKV